MYLIYTRGLRGPSAAKVPELPTDGSGRALAVLAKHALTAEQYALPIRVLEQFYPAPKP